MRAALPLTASEKEDVRLGGKLLDAQPLALGGALPEPEPVNRDGVVQAVARMLAETETVGGVLPLPPPVEAVPLAEPNALPERAPLPLGVALHAPLLEVLLEAVAHAVPPTPLLAVPQAEAEGVTVLLRVVKGEALALPVTEDEDVTASTVPVGRMLALPLRVCAPGEGVGKFDTREVAVEALVAVRAEVGVPVTEGEPLPLREA